jgi:hypothetical protein
MAWAVRGWREHPWFDWRVSLNWSGVSILLDAVVLIDGHGWMRALAMGFWMWACAVGVRGAELPDISSVPADLVVPSLSEGTASAGARVRVGVAEGVHHVLYLPLDWEKGRRWPVLVEFAGNGNYRNRFGDESRGRPEDSCLGYGLSAGRGYIWLCLPYLSGDGTRNVITWWGDSPRYDVTPTVEYCVKTIEAVCRDYSGDASRVVLCGFSRGAIATHFIGLQNDRVAGLWRGFFAYSHFDGPHRWPYPGSDEASAAARFSRVGNRPNFVCGEGDNAEETRRWLESKYGDSALGAFTFRGTGFRNHSDAWILRPGPVRETARRWLSDVVR